MDITQTLSEFRPLYKETIDPKLCDLCFLLEGDFSKKGVWAGVTDLFEMIYTALKENNEHEILDQHNYELHMVLPNHRDALPLKYACLTDVAVGQEKTRNFPLDRAYRIINGLVDLLVVWKQHAHAEDKIAVLVKNAIKTQHLAEKFYNELARRAHRFGLFVLFETFENNQIKQLNSSGFRTFPAPASIRTLGDSQHSMPVSDETLNQIKHNIYKLDDNWEEKFLLLNQHYCDQGLPLERAKILLQANCFYNHFGYYYESGALAQDIRPFFNEIVGDDQTLRWNYVGNMFQGLITTNRQTEAQQVIREFAEPFITENVLRAKMHYLLAMVHLRYLDDQDMELAEQHLVDASACIAKAKHEVNKQEFYFLTVFINNGIAFLRVKQNKPKEAIKLCQEGYRLLGDKLGSQEHKLHRSVLLYNTAQVYMMLGDFQNSLNFYQEAIKLDPYYSEYYNEMGNIHQRLENYTQANQCYEQALNYSAPYAEAYFNQGLNHFNSGNPKAALTCLVRSDDIDPNQPDLYLILGEIYEEQEDLELAINSYSKALEFDNINVTAYLNRAVLYYQIGDYEQSQQDLIKVIEIEPNNQDAIDNLNLLRKEVAVS